MATRASIIALRHDHDGYRVSYLRFDGMPTSSGRILFENYTTQSLVDELMDLGHLETLGIDLTLLGGTSAFLRDCISDPFSEVYGGDPRVRFEFKLLDDAHKCADCYDPSFIYLWNGSSWLIYYDGDYSPLQEHLHVRSPW